MSYFANLPVGTRSRIAGFFVLFCFFIGAPPLVWANERSLGERLEMLVRAYPAYLAGLHGNLLVWKDGTTSIIDDGKTKTHQARLKNADIDDMLLQAYPLGPCSYASPARNFDPGRIRNDAFFRKIYGSSKTAARRNLVSISWFGRSLQVTRVNNVDKKLTLIAKELALLPKSMHLYFKRTGGTFNWRLIAGTKRLSVHSFGAAIDINTKFADYWRWSGGKPGRVPNYRNRIPREIVEIFERHGFIWGGKWYHYDTMHFEFRPEILAFAARPANDSCK